MAEVMPKDILLRIGCGPHGVVVAGGARRAHGTFAPPYTHTRADPSPCATEIDRDGIIRTATANKLRIEWVDLDGDGVRETPGLLLEGSRQNVLTRSEEIDHADWAKTNITITANFATAPDNTGTADKIAATAAAATTLTQSKVVADTVCTYIIHAKIGSGASDGNRFGVRNATTATDLIFGSIDYGTGVWSYTIGSSGVTVQRLGAGWYRITIIVTAGITSGDTITVYAGFVGASESAGEYFYAWGACLTPGPGINDSYIKTIASAVIRAVDSLNASVNFGRIVCSLYADFVERTIHTSSSDGRILTLGTAGFIAPYLAIQETATGGYRALFDNGGGIVASGTLSYGAFGDRVRMVARLYPDGHVELERRINNNVASTASSAASTLTAGSWSAQQFWLNGGNGATVDAKLILDAMAIRDPRTLAECEAAS